MRLLIVTKTYQAMGRPIFFLLSVFTGICLSAAILAKISADVERIAPQSPPIPIKHHAEFKTDPINIRAEEPAELRFDVKNEQGENVRFLEFVHEKPLHLMIVSNDLSEFYHVHPELIIDYYSIANTFPYGGKYHLFSDYTPPGGIRTLEQFEVNVAGKQRKRVALSLDTNLTKTVEGVSVNMMGNAQFRAKQDYLVKFTVADAVTKQPATDLQLYLGALAHVAIFSQDLKDFIHAHPLEAGEVYDPSKSSFHAHNPEELAKQLVGPSPSEVEVSMIFPRAGIYKMWVQLKRHDQVINVPYTIKVGEAEKTESSNTETPLDAVRISISKNGYEPSRIELKRGVPAKLAFTRTDAENCGGTVVFPSLNIRRDLPFGKTEIIEFIPSETGDISFTCGMGMYRGIVAISE